MIQIIIGLFIIGIGFGQIFPQSNCRIQYYVRRKKENVDIVGLSTFIRNGLIAMGLILSLDIICLNYLVLHQ